MKIHKQSVDWNEDEVLMKVEARLNDNDEAKVTARESGGGI